MPFVLDNESVILRTLPGAVTGVGTARILITFPVGPTYENIAVRCMISTGYPTRANLESMLPNWRLMLSGEEIFNLSGLELIAFTEFYTVGITGATGVVNIPFTQPWMKRIESVMAGRLGTQGETSLTLEITTSSSTIDGVVAEADIAPKAEPLGTNFRIERYPLPLQGAGRTEWSGFKPRKGDFLYALAIKSDDISDLLDITLSGDGVRIWDQVTQLQWATRYLKFSPARTQQDAKEIAIFDAVADGEDRPIPLTMDTFTLGLNWSQAPSSIAALMLIGTTRQTQAGLQFLASQPKG